MFKAVLFDMDGTLIPLDIDVFIGAYFGELAKKLSPHGYDKDALIDGIWKGTGAMIKNDGAQTNEEVFWKVFASCLGDRVYDSRPLFEEFYRNEFNNVKKIFTPAAEAAAAVRLVKESGAIAVLASNPIFPLVAQEGRARWTGIDPADFSYMTAYENCRFCKPNLRYYEDILSHIDVDPADCLMVGNDVAEDMCAAKLGMHTFLVTPHMINEKNEDISKYPSGDLSALCDYLKESLE